jgi:hypothetical protein
MVKGCVVPDGEPVLPELGLNDVGLWRGEFGIDGNDDAELLIEGSADQPHPDLLALASRALATADILVAMSVACLAHFVNAGVVGRWFPESISCRFGDKSLDVCSPTVRRSDDSVPEVVGRWRRPHIMMPLARIRAVAGAVGVHRYQTEAVEYVSPQWCNSPNSWVAPMLAPTTPIPGTMARASAMGSLGRLHARRSVPEVIRNLTVMPLPRRGCRPRYV